MNEEIKKKYKIENFYRYAEKKIGDRIEFGWQPTNDVDMPAVVSYASKSKSVTEEQKEWSANEGANATSLTDYRKYFKALVGDDPDIFLEKWKDKMSEFPVFWEAQQTNYTIEHGEFIIALAHLIEEDKKFSMFGRLYKVIRE